MMSEWIDETSYRNGERGEKEPSIWTLKLDEMRLVVHRIHGLEGWYMSVYGGTNINDQKISGVEDIEKAKFVALDQMVSKLSSQFHRWYDLQKRLLA